jgi:hypothetical protein
MDLPGYCENITDVNSNKKVAGVIRAPRQGWNRTQQKKRMFLHFL